MKHLHYVSLLGAALACAPANAEELFLGSMLPPITIETMTGKGTAGAVAEGTPLEADMAASCESALLDPTKERADECVGEMKEKHGRPYRVTADCVAGTMQPAIGGTWTYAGVYTPDEAFGEKGLTKWRDANGEIQPVARASDAYSLDQNWKVLCGEDARPVKIPPAPAVSRSKPSPASSASASSEAPPSAQSQRIGALPYDHNGSVVTVDERSGEIRYQRPKRAIAGTVRPGTLLFKGTFREKAGPGESAHGTVEGTAYVFKKGCAPAPYRVSGTYDAWTITLSGAAPRRDPRSCAILGISNASPHAVLTFEPLGDY